MAETPSPSGALAEALRHMAPYLPGFAGAVLSMAVGERLTIRGKLLSAAVGMACVVFIAPTLSEVAALFWPGDSLPTAVVTTIGFVSGLFGMIMLAGFAAAAAKYSRDPFKLIRIQLPGGGYIGGTGDTT